MALALSLGTSALLARLSTLAGIKALSPLTAGAALALLLALGTVLPLAGISPLALALAVGQSRAKRILIPVNHCDNIVVGVEDLNMGRLIAEAVERILKNAEEKG